MNLAISNSTPLLNAFRGTGRARGQAVVAGAWFQNLLTLLGCLVPVAVCLYLVDIQPLFSVGDVEFTQPDVVSAILAVVVIARAFFKGFLPPEKSFFLPLFLFLLSAVASAFNAADLLRGAAGVIQILEFGLLAWCFSH